MFFWRWARYWLFRFVVFACRRLPDRFLYWVALRIADLNFLFDRRGREAVQANLRTALPGAAPERIYYESRWVFRNFGKYLTEFFRFRTFDRRYFDVRTTLVGKRHIDDALAGGKGCIGVSAHLSNWELGGAALARQFGYPVTAAVVMNRDPRINSLFMRERESANIQAVDIYAPGAIRRLHRALKDNRFVAILGDRDPTGGGVTIEFFGKPCRFPQGPARLSLATGAPILPGHAIRRSNDSFCVEMFPPVPIPETGARDERVRAVTQAYARVLEEAIRRHPEEWTVFYPIWEQEWEPT